MGWGTWLAHCHLLTFSSFFLSAAANKHLTPCTLELGGESICQAIVWHLSRKEPCFSWRRSSSRWNQAGSRGEAPPLGEVQQRRFLNYQHRITVQYGDGKKVVVWYIWNQGQICVAPDYVLCSPKLEARLVPLLEKTLVGLFDSFSFKCLAKFLYFWNYFSLLGKLTPSCTRLTGILKLPCRALITVK